MTISPLLLFFYHKILLLHQLVNIFPPETGYSENGPMKENYQEVWKRKAFKIKCDLDALSRASPDSEKGEIEYLIESNISL